MALCVGSRLEALGEALRHETVQHAFGPESVLCNLFGLQDRAGELVARELAAIKDPQDLVALVWMRCPVDDEQAAHGERQTEFLENLSSARLSGAFCWLYVATGDVPALLVGGFHKEHLAGGVADEQAGGHPRGCDNELVRGRHDLDSRGLTPHGGVELDRPARAGESLGVASR